MKLIPIKDCIKRRVYKLDCRNLSHGVYNGDCEFIGIRTKFGSRFLFAEVHYDASDMFGTVRRMEDTGIDVPNDIELRENMPSVDRKSGRPVYFDKPIDDGGRGWVFEDTDEADENIWPVGEVNRKLFKFLDNIKEK